MTTRLWSALDVRPAEVRPVGTAFASLLFIVVAHSLLETARDAMFLVHVGPEKLGYMYIVAAVVTLVVGAASARLGATIGVRRTLLGAQLASAAGAAAFFFLPPTLPALVGLYAFGAISGAVLVPQLWTTTAGLFHPGQGRRLFGLIALAGVLGAVLGTSLAALLLTRLEVRTLLLGSTGAFLLSAMAIVAAPAARARTLDVPAQPQGSWRAALRSEPVLVRLAIVVALGAVTSVFVDFLFKSVAAAHVAPHELGPFFARYYLIINVLALIAQVVVSRRVLSRAGVIGTAGFMPGLMLLGSLLGFLSGGALFAVLGTKAVDGALRHSVNRTGLELVYLAVPSAVRDRVRPIIDGALPRLAQALAAGLLLALAAWRPDRPREIALVTLLFAVGWSAATASLHKPYVELFRRALLGESRIDTRSPEELDLASVELLVETLASERSREVVAAVDALTRRGRARLVPALLLLRQEEDVLELVLSVLGPSGRTDWPHLAEKLTSDKREKVRRAAMRALARARQSAKGPPPGGEASSAERPWIRGYLAVDEVRRGAPAAAQLGALTPDADGDEARLGMLTALQDAPPSPALAELCAAIADRARADLGRDARVLLARAAAAQRATALLPRMVRDLARRDLRDETRAALVAMGQPAHERVTRDLLDPRTPRDVRLQLPLTIAELGSQQGADLLFDLVRNGDDGRVRYRCLRALERMVSMHVLRLSMDDVRELIERELVEHFRILAIVAALGVPPITRPAPSHEQTRDLLLRVLDDKRWQAIGRTFQLLKLCFPGEDLRQVHAAFRAPDAATRGNAVEFLDALLAPARRRRNESLRALLRCVAEDLTIAERLERAAAVAPIPAPQGIGGALDVLRRERDTSLVALGEELERARAAAGLSFAHDDDRVSLAGVRLVSVAAT